jgi:lysophospholipid acyltransferase (LPLAT)-like uncharacterized protein
MSPRKIKLVSHAGAWLMRALIATLRFRVNDLAGVLGKPPEPRLLWAFWHNRLFVVPHLFNRFLPLRRGAALASASRDGAVVAAFLERFGIRPVRGSSSRRGAAALLEMKRLIGEGYDIGITPDGPRGPRYQLNPGIVHLAQSTGLQIIPLHVEYSRCFRFKSWDGFMVPLPFSRVEITLGALQSIAPTATPEAFEAERERIEKIMQPVTI